MSVLSQPTPTQDKANFIKALPLTLFNSLLAQWQNGVQLIWNDPNPQSVLDAIGTDAATIFDLSSKTADFLESVMPGSTTATVALVKPFTINADGTLTINP